MHDQETPKQRAIRLLTDQLKEIGTHIYALNDDHPDFKAWRDTTRGYLERFLGKENHHTTRFRDTRFYGPSYVRSDYPGVPQGPSQREIQEKAEAFQKGCDTSRATLQAAIKEIQEFGLYVEQPKAVPARRGKSGNGGGVTQTFNAPVTIHSQAIATDNAIQNIGQMGDQTIGASLKEIAQLLQQSEELSPRQVRDGLAHIEAVAVEEQKPEPNRNWGVLLERGSAILDLIGKASDLTHKLAPYAPAITALVEAAGRHM